MGLGYSAGGGEKRKKVGWGRTVGMGVRKARKGTKRKGRFAFSDPTHFPQGPPAVRR